MPAFEGILFSTAPIVAVRDGDLQHDERLLPEMYAAFQGDGDLDLAIGSRKLAGGSAEGGLSPPRQWGSDLATRL